LTYKDYSKYRSYQRKPRDVRIMLSLVRKNTEKNRQEQFRVASKRGKANDEGKTRTLGKRGRDRRRETHRAVPQSELKNAKRGQERASKGSKRRERRQHASFTTDWQKQKGGIEVGRKTRRDPTNVPGGSCKACHGDMFSPQNIHRSPPK